MPEQISPLRQRMIDDTSVRTAPVWPPPTAWSEIRTTGTASRGLKHRNIKKQENLLALAACLLW